MYPHIMEQLYRVSVEYQSYRFAEEVQRESEEYRALYLKLQKENERLFKEKQKALTDAFAYEENRINLGHYGILQEYIGFIEIPVMDIKLPIYLGANKGNMKKGAVHLTETSYPIGGNNTNCVIAAHRGYSKTAMFRDIERLKEGDYVFIENFREKLIYRVKECYVISPTETDCLRICEDKELLTLITCHPYRYNYQRYVVLCERTEKK